MADPLKGDFSIRTFQDHNILSFIPHGSPLQIRRAFLPLFFKKNQWNEHDRRIGLIDCIEGIRFLYHPVDLYFCFNRISRLFQGQLILDHIACLPPDRPHLPCFFLHEQPLKMAFKRLGKDIEVDQIKKCKNILVGSEKDE